jgi:hypothetical protein
MSENLNTECSHGEVSRGVNDAVAGECWEQTCSRARLLPGPDDAVLYQHRLGHPRPRSPTAWAGSALRPPRTGWTPRSVPKELTASATPTAAQVMDSGLCQEPDQPQPDPGKQPHAGREYVSGRGQAGDGGHDVAAVQPVDRPRSQPIAATTTTEPAAAHRVAGDPADPGHRSVLIGATPRKGPAPRPCGDVVDGRTPYGD